MLIVELTNDDELREAFPVFHELRFYVDERRFFERLAVMRPRGYRSFVVRDEGQVVAYAGVEITETMRGRQLYVHEMVTTEQVRSQGYGAAMMAYLEDFARQNECDILTLSSNVAREGAHRFYETKIGMTRTSYLFRKELR
jgi:GNAT superfamily N-acetyltransferase